jgi:hypothetical protein
LSKPQARNDIEAAVPKFCFGLEVHRRTPDGRVRTAQEFLAHFFPHDTKSSTDRIFHYMPAEVRAPILTAWGVRGRKSALLDDDAKVQSVMHDALVAGDVDASMFEEALASDTIMRWIDLSDWWTFWRGGKITKYTILKALESGYDLGLFDADWFLDSVRGHGGKLRGTDVLAEGLNKADLTEWVRRIHESGDGSPRGLLAALGWDQIVAKTADSVLVAVLDAMAVKVSLAPTPEAKASSTDVKAETKAVPVDAKAAVPTPAKADAKAEPLPLKVEAPTANSHAVVPAAAAPALPGVLIPSTAVTTDKDGEKAKPAPAQDNNEETIDHEAAAQLFKDDELIPISGSWDEGDEPDAAASPNLGNEERKRGSKPPGKRMSKNPPPAPVRGSK